ncbi:AraC family transcriptional regulator N-terminal domain-containing protein [Pseudomonas sp. NPDC087612]|uniref:AraC family transcriptional regulator n=1 Tax=unclassified Pseudomonas TaxID=196821 RepID=UPI0005EB98DF|nr:MULTISPECIES: AraC family transcriptional regulator [unclassified Pseudomonas]KJK17543.1 AraC family transcriptional regulator [Pseudomonas sp. 2(2015)]QVM97760.1 AraC family transcriptional regulator [Pseudomonas sp. SORT22]UVL55361.1 AraC family transcriptional regulator [Pseudomonas sp. B21-035]UVL60645.1 AraC family transcriptional regulator [Pseudomonas sp. B21-032]SDQ42842.1 transcriptional regulator, AraC family [Pseudomonas sp. UC 17F4]
MSATDPNRLILDPALERQRQELADLIQRHAPRQAGVESAVEDLFLVRYEESVRSMPALAEPALCILAHGSKEVCLGDERYMYDPLHYMVVSVALPISGVLLEASPENPSLGVRLNIDPAQINNLLADAGPLGVPSLPSGRGLYVERTDPLLLDALLRLIRLLDSPKDIPILAPLIQREILYRLLRGPQGYRLYEIAMANSQTHRVCQAIEWLNQHFDRPLRIDELAREVNLSTSTLHHRFKAVTSMSPLQYQKQLRLQEARRLMLNDGLEAAVAGYRVGYESPSQFSREYSRLYGAPPVRDLARLRSAL